MAKNTNERKQQNNPTKSRTEHTHPKNKHNRRIRGSKYRGQGR